MSHRTSRFAVPLVALIAFPVVSGCTSSPTQTGAATATQQTATAAASTATLEPGASVPVDPSADATTGEVKFSGTIDDVIAEMTNAGLVCADTTPAKGFDLQTCTSYANGNRLSALVYSRRDAAIAGVDMTYTGPGAIDSDSLIGFVAISLGGAMGPDAFNAVSDAISARLDGSSPQPAFLSGDLRLTVRVSSGSSAYITVLAADLAAAWGS